MLNPTIVSMTGENDRTGNADFKDGRMPTEQDLVNIAKKYKFKDNILVTIVSPVGVKQKFHANFKKGKMQIIDKINYDTTRLQNICIEIRERELEKIRQYQDFPYASIFLEELEIKEEDVWAAVKKRRESRWMWIPDEYKQGMFNLMLAEQVQDMLKE